MQKSGENTGTGIENRFSIGYRKICGCTEQKLGIYLGKKSMQNFVKKEQEMRDIILASGSPRRKELLTQIGVVFQVKVSEAEEKITTKNPGKAVEELSRLKCSDIYGKTSGDVLVIGSDTVVSINGQILGKPASEEEAVQMLKNLQGKSHEVYTGVTIMVRENQEEKSCTFHEKTEVLFYPMTEAEIKSYVSTGEPMDKAGAYGIQGKSAVFVKGINGDYNNVVGLPLARLYQELKNMGIEIKEW